MRTPALPLAAALLLGASLTGTTWAGTPAATPLPNNLGLGLRDLARDYRDAATAAAIAAPALRGKDGHPVADAAVTGTGITARMQTVLARYAHLQVDASGRVLVDIYGDGTVPPALLKQRFADLGMTLSGEIDWYRNGVYSAWVAPSQIENLARLAGVHTARLSPRPHYRVGQTTSQGAAVLHADAVNASGYDGTGIKVGVLSDSFNDTAPQDPAGVPDNAALDQVMGDLPASGVSVLLDDPIVATATDEGRAMCQIVHDVAPGAAIAFATAEGGESTFAANILGLGTPTGSISTGTPAYPGMGCNIICDDVSYLAEPMYSDGVIAQAIDAVATQYGVSYFSSAGNDGNSGYQGTFTYTNPATVINAAKKVVTPDTPSGGLDFSFTTDSMGNTTGVDPTFYAGGLHSFGNDASGKPIVAQKVTVGSLATSLVFQWNDPFDAGAVTTDYKILVFDATGTYQSGMSGTAANISSGSLDLNGTDEPIEMPTTMLAASTTYYIVLCRATPTGNASSPATRLRYAAESDGGGFSGDFIGLDSIETYGHNCAANCSGVAAYVYDAIPNVNKAANHVFTPLVEPFSSNGPVEIYFDAKGNRLATPNRRRQPAFAAIDGVNTSFFPPAMTNVIVPGTPVGDLPLPTLPITLPITTGPNPNDYDGDGFPNFFGTSAAAPHAAAVAALVLQASAKNGLGTLTPSYVRTLLQSTTQGQADTAPGYCVASGTTGGYKVTLSGTGDVSTDPNTFRVTLVGPSGYQLNSLVINLAPSGLVFDENATTGYPFTQGNVGTSDAGGATLQMTPQPALSTDRSTATLLFGGFNPGLAVTFGVDRDVAGINAYGNGVDQLQGSTFIATLVGVGGPITIQGTFTNLYSRVYNYKAGYGLIDAQAAVNRLLTQ